MCSLPSTLVKTGTLSGRSPRRPRMCCSVHVCVSLLPERFHTHTHTPRQETERALNTQFPRQINYFHTSQTAANSSQPPQCHYQTQHWFFFFFFLKPRLTMLFCYFDLLIFFFPISSSDFLSDLWKYPGQVSGEDVDICRCVHTVWQRTSLGERDEIMTESNTCFVLVQIVHMWMMFVGL